jgi:hypothetical protein
MDKIKVERKSYVEFFLPGEMGSADGYSSIREFNEETEDKSEVAFPKNQFTTFIPYAYRFMTRTEAEMPDGEVLGGEFKNNSPLYYPRAKLMSLEEVIRDEPEAVVLIKYVREGERAIKNNLGEIHLIHDKDVVLEGGK